MLVIASFLMDKHEGGINLLAHKDLCNVALSMTFLSGESLTRCLVYHLRKDNSQSATSTPSVFQLFRVPVDSGGAGTGPPRPQPLSAQRTQRRVVKSLAHGP